MRVTVSRNSRRPLLAALATMLVLPLSSLLAQQPGGDAARPMGRGQFAGMQRVGGELTAINGSTLTVKAEDSGDSFQIVTTDNTRLMRGTGGRGTRTDGGGMSPGGGGTPPSPAKLADLKVGDGIMAAGQMDDAHKTLHAVMVFATDGAVLKQMRENLGKTYITGRVTAIDLDNARLTIERPDHVSQTITLDENTSFRRGGGMMMRGMMGTGGRGMRREGADDSVPQPGGESITLADVKAGDMVMGQGALKNGAFVPGQLMVATPRRAPEGQPASAAPAK